MSVGHSAQLIAADYNRLGSRRLHEEMAAAQLASRSPSTNKQGDKGGAPPLSPRVGDGLTDYETFTVIWSESAPSSNSDRVAVVKDTSVITGVHCELGHVGVAGNGPGASVVTVNRN